MKAFTDLPLAPGVIAIPTLGGILTNEPLTPTDELRFPQIVCLPVTAAAAKTKRWMVVKTPAGGLAVSEAEAAELGLDEQPCWVPDLRGVSCVPAPGEIERHLAGGAP